MSNFEPKKLNKNWTIEDSISTYNIDKWGDEYFSINSKGNIAVTRDKKQVNHTNINVSWCTETDKVRNISDHMKPKDRGWACGATAGYFALLDEKPNEVYLIGHDLESVDGKLNNMYKDTKHYGLKEAHKTPSINWINQWLELYKENPNVQFYKVNPTADSCKDAISTPVKEWQGIGNLKYIDYMALDKMLEK